MDSPPLEDGTVVSFPRTFQASEKTNIALWLTDNVHVFISRVDFLNPL